MDDSTRLRRKTESLRGRADGPLVPVVLFLVGTALAFAAVYIATERLSERAAQQNSRAAAQISADVFLSVALERNDFTEGRLKRSAFGELEVATRQSDAIVESRLWRGDGKLLRTTATRKVDQNPKTPPQMGRVARGLSATSLLQPGDRSKPRSRTVGTDVSVTTPLSTPSGGPRQALQVITSDPVADVNTNVNQDIRLLLALIAAGLYALLLPTLLRTSRTVAAWHRARHTGLQRELGGAISRGELSLHYQPKLDLATDRPSGVEALLRWNHPKRGLLTAGEFIPQVEGSEVMGPLTDFVVEEVLDQIVEWIGRDLRLDVAINIPPSSLADPRFPDAIANRLAQRGLKGGCLVLEVTEQAIGGAVSVECLEGLRELDVMLSLDDFGTGHASLARLDSLPLSEFKIDRSLTMKLESQTESPLVESIVVLAHELGMRVVAEGVETAELAERVRAAGCDLAQGYGGARPMPPPQLEAWLATHERKADSGLEVVGSDHGTDESKLPEQV